MYLFFSIGFWIIKEKEEKEEWSDGSVSKVHFVQL